MELFDHRKNIEKLVFGQAGPEMRAEEGTEGKDNLKSIDIRGKNWIDAVEIMLTLYAPGATSSPNYRPIPDYIFKPSDTATLSRVSSYCSDALPENEKLAGRHRSH